MEQKLAFVIPAYNEEVSIEQTLRDVKKAFPGNEIFVVNDGSHDRTGELARKAGAHVHVLTHLVNRGLGAALSTGIQAAVNSGADIVVTFDADLQHMGSDVERLAKPITEGKADVVIGSRFLSEEDLKMMPSVKRIGNKFLTGFTNILSDTTITDSQSGLRAFSRQAAEKLMILCDRYEVSSEIIYELGHHNLRIIEIPIKAIYDKRSATKGTTIGSGLHIAWSMLLRTIGVKK